MPLRRVSPKKALNDICSHKEVLQLEQKHNRDFEIDKDEDTRATIKKMIENNNISLKSTHKKKTGGEKG